jgi:hypothetical protein
MMRTPGPKDPERLQPPEAEKIADQNPISSV